MKFREVILPSGAILKVAPAPFADSKALYQAVLEEMKYVKIDNQMNLNMALKDFLCTGLSSKKIEECLWVCFQRCIYNRGVGDLKIDKDTFEPIESRQDYLTVCLEVAQENINPFVKSLYATYQSVLSTLEKNPA